MDETTAAVKLDTPQQLMERLHQIKVDCLLAREDAAGTNWIVDAAEQRIISIAESVCQTLRGSREAIEAIVPLFLDWMNNGQIVRVIGAGRARLAAAIPANRLAHGGARVFVQDDIIPMPHTVRGGSVIAASASGKTESVLNTLRILRKHAPHITVVGIARAEASEFMELCHPYFVGIKEVRRPSKHCHRQLTKMQGGGGPRPLCPNAQETGAAAEPRLLSALADIGEHVISEVLDELVVAAGRLGGFDERKWQLGHENLGATGPYDAQVKKVDLLFNEPQW